MGSRFFQFRSRRQRDEDYLAKATDLADLERRMRNIDRASGRLPNF
ncbi:hypothetical protein B7H23_08850 [Notoacmeibacter marinus]|uniref:DUF3563 domain-containing protein n=1 Tax=Notoacmeibacter marinus TaxID=1876515 RepID=A0A231UWL1_9HYPH|nr:DUF3563 family protein [Notoacmeibacter marinus]OXT00262.1 hypothetical protein B7H23_08850 [Notoacmeibacter marinus]